MTKSFSLTPHEETLLNRIVRIWYGERGRNASQAIGRMILQTARQLGIEPEEGRVADSNQDSPPAMDEPEV